MAFPLFELVFAFACSLVACVVIVATRRFHGRVSFDSTLGVQKVHLDPTPRIGGVGIAVALVLAALVFTDLKLMVPLLLAGIPAFLAGLVEDTTKRVSVSARLIATIVSGVLAWYLTGVSLTRVNVVGLDALLSFVPVSVLFTAVAVAGASNAVNIVDGFNGLAAGAVLICLAALGLIAVRVGDNELLALTLVVGAVTAGFMVVNFPSWRLFLGDGGAYLLGFLVAWIAVMLPMRNPTVSVWAALLACGYPIIETIFSIVRRSKREGNHPGQADHLHLHTLLYRRVTRKLLPAASRTRQNAMTSPLVWMYALIPSLWASFFYAETHWLVAGAFGSAFLYRAFYLRLTQFRWCFSPVRRGASTADENAAVA